MSRLDPAVREREADRATPPILRTVLSGVSLSRCIPIMLIVGTTLSVINQAAVIWAGDTTWVTWLRVGLNYLVPFIVSSVAFYLGERAVWQKRDGAADDVRG